MGGKTCGVGAELATLVAEKAFAVLKAPPLRISLPDASALASSALENAYYSRAAGISSAVRGLAQGAGCRSDGS